MVAVFKLWKVSSKGGCILTFRPLYSASVVLGGTGCIRGRVMDDTLCGNSVY